VIQRKGWEYHLFIFFSFLMLWLALESSALLSSRGLRSALGVLVLLFFVNEAVALQRLSLRASYDVRLLNHLQADLNAMGGRTLDHKVQCMDMTLGSCINVLYRMQLQPSTGSMYDFYLFPPSPTALTISLQSRVYSAIEANPPQVIVLSAHNWPEERLTYDELARWPAFEDLLWQKYRMTTDFYEPGMGGYRIYRRKGEGT
jgi:hypothetical protein